MSYEAREAQTKRDQEYLNLKIRKKNIEDQAAAWVTLATELHGESPTQTDKDDILGQRASFISTLRTTLGV